MTVKHVKMVKKTISTSVQCPKYQFAGWNTQQTCGYNAMLAQLNCLNKINFRLHSWFSVRSLILRPAFRCLPIFSAIFNLFCWFCDFVIIIDLTAKINKKRLKMNKKIFFFSYFACSSKLVDNLRLTNKFFQLLC